MTETKYRHRERALIERQSFYGGWKFDEKTGRPERFDPMSKDLSPEERRLWAETLGFTYDMISKDRPGRITLEATPWVDGQVGFYARRLDEGTDFSYNRVSERPDLRIKNRAILWYFHNPLPMTSELTERSILSGLVSNLLLRTENFRKGRKIIHRVQNPYVAGSVKRISFLRGLYIAPPQRYEELVGIGQGQKKIVDMHSIWYLNPRELEPFVVEDFESHKEFLHRIPNWMEEDPRAVVLEQHNFLFGRELDVARHRNLIGPSEYEELKIEQQRVRKELKCIENIIESLQGPATLDMFDGKGMLSPQDRSELLRLKRSEVVERLGELQERVFKIKHKHHNGNKPAFDTSYRDRQASDMRARARAGEL